jgi:hypothetical protein
VTQGIGPTNNARTIARLEVENSELRRERDAYMAYAAMLQIESTLKVNGLPRTPAEAVGHVSRDAFMAVSEAALKGWGAGECASLMNCRDAVAAFQEAREEARGGRAATRPLAGIGS